jgi:hypothetical protein
MITKSVIINQGSLLCVLDGMEMRFILHDDFIEPTRIVRIVDFSYEPYF